MSTDRTRDHTMFLLLQHYCDLLHNRLGTYIGYCPDYRLLGVLVDHLVCDISGEDSVCVWVHLTLQSTSVISLGPLHCPLHQPHIHMHDTSV